MLSNISDFLHIAKIFNKMLQRKGSHRGKKMNPAVFVYFFQIKRVDGKQELIKRDITWGESTDLLPCFYVNLFSDGNI